jgi:hypothetical protein
MRGSTKSDARLRPTVTATNSVFFFCNPGVGRRICAVGRPVFCAMQMLSPRTRVETSDASASLLGHKCQEARGTTDGTDDGGGRSPSFLLISVISEQSVVHFLFEFFCRPLPAWCSGRFVNCPVVGRDSSLRALSGRSMIYVASGVGGMAGGNHGLREGRHGSVFGSAVLGARVAWPGRATPG